MPLSWKKLLSHLWPVPVESVQGTMGELEVRWENGRKVLNSHGANQSFGSLHQVWRLTFEAIHLANDPPGNVLMLGLGGGSIPRILRDELGLCPAIVAIEQDPVMIDLARRHFDLPPDITVLEGDALIQIHALKERFALVCVDLFHDLNMVRGVETNGFIHALRDRTGTNGACCFNTVAYDQASDIRCERVLSQLKKAFSNVQELRFAEVNRVFVAS